MNKKQTVVDWLIEEIEFMKNMGFDFGAGLPTSVIEQANVMFQNQIQDAWDNGAEHWDAEMDGNDYYNETFGDSK